MNPLEDAAGHAEDLRVVLHDIRPQLERDPGLMARIRSYVTSQGGDGSAAARQIEKYRERAIEAVATAEVALGALRRIYDKVDSR